MAKRIKEEILEVSDSGVVEMTTWINKLDVVARFEIQETTPRYAKTGKSTYCGAFRTVVVPPGKSVELPSYLDQAIRRENPETGEVIGGKCPWLSREDDEGEVFMAEGLDFKVALRAEQLDKMTKNASRDRALAEKYLELEETNKKLDAAAELLKQDPAFADLQPVAPKKRKG